METTDNIFSGAFAELYAAELLKDKPSEAFLKGLKQDMDYATHPEPQNFLALQEFINALPNQQKGKAGPMTDDGNAYIEIHECHIARPADVASVEAHVVSMMKYRLRDYLHGRGDNVIHWRKPLEWEITGHEEIIRFDRNGPDKDLRTDRKCHKDKNWIAVKGYMRLYCAKQKADA